LPADHRRVLLHGTGDERVKVQVRGAYGGGSFRMRYEGAINSMMRRMRETQSEDMRTYYQRFLSNRPCSACQGRRIRKEALGVKLADLTIASELMQEIRSRLRFLVDVGLGYLTLDRPAPSLSGGEGQRIRLASQIG